MAISMAQRVEASRRKITSETIWVLSTWREFLETSKVLDRRTYIVIEVTNLEEIPPVIDAMWGSTVEGLTTNIYTLGLNELERDITTKIHEDPIANKKVLDGISITHFCTLNDILSKDS